MTTGPLSIVLLGLGGFMLLSTLPVIVAGIDATLAAGLHPVKINAVVVRGFNDDELEPMAAWARDLGVELRFIEFMPLDAPGDWTRDQVVPAGEILARLDAAFGLEAPDPRGSAPAERYRYRDGRGAVGVIASVTRAFCAQCDRIRLTADGQVRTCLFATTEHDLRSVLRSGAGDDAVAPDEAVEGGGSTAMINGDIASNLGLPDSTPLARTDEAVVHLVAGRLA